MTALKYFILLLSICTAIVLLGVRLWANNQALVFEGPSFMQVTKDQSTLTVLISNQFVDISRDGDITNILHLGRLGKRVQGSFAYFPNGDILFYHYAAKTPVISQFAKYLRLKDQENNIALGDEGFYRCNKKSTLCSRWANEFPPLGDHAYGLTVDPLSGEVYISATAKFILYKMNEEGELLAKNTTGLKFPNAIKLYNNMLYVADTNNHRIKVVRTKNERFGEEIISHEAKVDQVNFRWPVSVERAGNTWFVMVNDQEMYNSKLLRFNVDWMSYDEVELPSHAWLIGLTYFDNKVWVANLDRFELYRFGQRGNRLSDFSNEKWDALNEFTLKEKHRFEQLAYFSLLGMLACLGLGFTVAYLLEKSKKRDR